MVSEFLPAQESKESREIPMRRLTQSYNHGASKVPLIGQTIVVFFDHAVELWGNRQALIVQHQNIRWTYTELKKQVDAFLSLIHI